MWAGSDLRGGDFANRGPNYLGALSPSGWDRRSDHLRTFLRRGTRQNASAGKSTPNLKETIVVVVVVVIFESVVVVVVGFVAVAVTIFLPSSNKTNSFFFGK